MVDIDLDILTSSLVLGKEKTNFQYKYKVKTIWCQVDFEEGHTSIRLPRLQIIDHYLLNREDTIVFLEIWIKKENDEAIKFYGLSRCSIGRQLENRKLNPSVQWWEVYDPVQDVVRGQILLRIDAKFSVESLSLNKCVLQGGCGDNDSPKLPMKSNPVSSYFSTKYTSATAGSQTGEFICKEVQTDLSLISLSHISNKYKNYNNTTRNDLASSSHTTNVKCGNSDNSDAISNNICRSRSAASPKSSDLVEKNQKVVQGKKISVIPFSTTKNAPPVASQKSISLENIIDLLNENDQSVTKEFAALTFEREYSKSRKNRHNIISKLDEQGREAPDGRNETDSDILASTLNSPAKSSKSNVFVTKVPTASFPRKGQYSSSRKPTHSASAEDTSPVRPLRMAAALSFSKQ